MEQLYEILEEMNPEVDFHTETALIDDHLLDSLTVLALISELGMRLTLPSPRLRLFRRTSTPLRRCGI